MMQSDHMRWFMKAAAGSFILICVIFVWGSSVPQILNLLGEE